jgi:hypothetical protein
VDLVSALITCRRARTDEYKSRPIYSHDTTCCVAADEVLLLCSPNRRGSLLESFKKYIFPLDR